jgi:lipoprotein-releasing system ATP-binding protein
VRRLVPENHDALALDGIVRTFVQGDERLEVLRGASVAIQPGESVALVGPSGAGKSTLLHIAGLLEGPDAGEVRIKGALGSTLSDPLRTQLRRESIGFVYQFHHLLPEFSALENVALPRLIAGASRADANETAATLLRRLELGNRLHHRPGRLSGGEQQRVAIARAIANKPAVLLADEPTGNLDQSTADIVFAELLEIARVDGLAALIATHNERLAERMDRCVVLQDGVLVEK